MNGRVVVPPVGCKRRHANMRRREHSRVDGVLLGAHAQAYGVRYNRGQGPRWKCSEHPPNRCGLSQFQNSLVLEFSEEAGHAIVVPQGKRGLAWTHKEQVQVGKIVPVTDFCGTGGRVFQWVRHTARRIKLRRARTRITINSPARRLPAIMGSCDASLASFCCTTEPNCPAALQSK